MVKLAGGSGSKVGGGFALETPKLPSGRTLQFRGKGNYLGQSGFRVEFDRSGAELTEELKNDSVRIRGASVDAVEKTTIAFKEQVRDFIDAHFTNSEIHANNRRRVSNASAQSKFYNDLDSKGQYTGLVYSKFGHRTGGGFIDFLLLHIRGGTIRPKGDWLRLENERAGLTSGKIAQTGYFKLSNSDIFFTESKDGKKLFQLRRNRSTGKTDLLATLVKSIVVPADLAGIEVLARTRAELFEGHFAQALAQQDFGTA